ncbi:MAG: hypothetical protein A2Z95_01255 [Gallionellales bacterium GWA2_60_18]|nr:MAG: hypothetical protein A2Z95_01255 [Gallionellales bacterium GWA2_60_18]
MRRLDRWLGIPLCWCMTLLRRVRAMTPARDAQPDAPRRVLFVLLSESGSMVLADPAVRALSGAVGAEAFFLTFEHNRPALALTGTVPGERIFSLHADRPLALLPDIWRWRRWVRDNGIDTVVDLELFACLSAALCAVSGVRRRAGFHASGGIGRYRGDLYTHRVAYDPARHISHNYLALTDALLGRAVVRHELPEPPRRTPRAPETAAVQTLLRAALPQRRGYGTLLLLNPNASELLPQRRWPVPHFVALACRLLERHADLDILLIGSASDAATTAQIAAAVADPRCADIAGHLALDQLPALFAQADTLVSNDSGPAHFAAVSDLPVVVLFGPETPVLYRPLGRATVLSAGLPCSPCVNVGNQRQTRCRDNRCMREIPVEAVLAALEDVLAQPALPANVTPLRRSRA